MKYINELRESDFVHEHYLCKRKLTQVSKNGKNYLSLTLTDKTGSIVAKVWDLNKHIQSFENNDYIKVEGTILLYNNELQLKITKIRKSMDGEYNSADYIASTERNIEDLYKEFMSYIDEFENHFIKELCLSIFNSPEVKNEFKLHSAAKTIHHSYLGGLLEHSMSVAQICRFLSHKYKYINSDLLIATAMLHDIGKIFELAPFPVNDYTDDGQLLGHIYIGTEFINKHADKIDGFPHELKTLIKHSILAHHGEYDYGSPKRPKTIEAYLLHHADNMDSQLKIFEDALSHHNTKSPWAGYNKIFDRNVRMSEFHE